MSGLAIEPLNPAILPAATGNYAHGVQVDGAERMVFVSGQVPWGNEHGRVPETFEAQCRMVWRNVLSVLAEAGMGIRNLVKVTTYLSDRQYRGAELEDPRGGARRARPGAHGHHLRHLRRELAARDRRRRHGLTGPPRAEWLWKACVRRLSVKRMRIRVVDAFADRPFAGNPAGVCVLPAGAWPEEPGCSRSRRS